jgi:8-oxo-dGTP pyrophosphatase MutT (NUDIX family)
LTDGVRRTRIEKSTMGKGIISQETPSWSNKLGWNMIMSAGIILVRREEEGWKVLLLRAYRNWDFPKGVVESGEDPMEAAVREVKEETGISELYFKWGHDFKETAPYESRGKKIARYYIAETPRSEVLFSRNPELGKAEHHEYRWVSRDELRELAPPRLLKVIEWAGDLIASK